MSNANGLDAQTSSADVYRELRRLRMDNESLRLTAQLITSRMTELFEICQRLERDVADLRDDLALRDEYIRFLEHCELLEGRR